MKRTLSIGPMLCLVLSLVSSLLAGGELDSVYQIARLPLPVKELVPAQALTLAGKHPSEYHFAIANPTEKQVEAWLRGDFLPLDGVFLVDTTGSGSVGHFFQHASETVGLARAAIAEVRRIGNFISQFDGSSLVKLPVGMSKQLGDGTMFTVSINRMTLYPSHAELTVYIEVMTGDMEKPLYFGSPAIRFTRMGGVQLGEVGLLGDFGIPILNQKAMLEFQGAHVGPDDEFVDGVGTYANFDCDGVSQFNLDVDIAFDRSVIRPADLADPSQIRSELNLDAQNGLNDIVVAIDIDRPFVHQDKTNVIWTVSNVVFDFSESHNDPSVVFPIAEYTPDLPPGDNGTFPMWKGVYIGEFSVQLPEDLFGSGSQAPQVGVNDLLIDHAGFTGFVHLEPVLSLNEGNMDGWAFSVDRLEVQFYQNSLAAFEFNGKVNLPIFNNSEDGTPQDTACVAYFSSFDIRDQQYAFSMNDTEARVYEVKMLRARVTLLPTSRLDITYSPENGFDAMATLNGSLTVDAGVGQGSGGPHLRVPEVGFENLMIANRNGFIRNHGYWDVDAIEVRVNAFTLTVSDISMMDGAEPNTADLAFAARVNMGSGNVTFSANGGFRLQGVIEELDEGRQNWRFERFKMDMLRVHFENSEVAFEGHVVFFEDIAAYGAGFQGKMSLTLKRFDGVGVEAMGLFGSLNEDRYFFVDVMTRLPAGVVSVGALDFRGFGGGVYVNMAQGALVSDFSTASDTAILPHYDPAGGAAAADAYQQGLTQWIGRSLSGIQYVVDPSIKFGINFGVVVATAVNEETFNANVVLNMEFEDSGGLRKLQLQGYANAMAPISWSGPSCTGVSVAFTMKYVNGNHTASGVGEFTAQADVYVNILDRIWGNSSGAPSSNPGGDSGADCELRYAGGVDIKFSTQDWWINLGVPRGANDYYPGGPISLAADIFVAGVSLDAYLDIGNRIPPFPGLPDRVAELTRLPNLLQDESDRASGRGFAFGVDLEVRSQIDVIGIVEASLDLGVGFDIMLQHYNMTCANIGGEAIGFNGWYAAGQAWAYVEGNVSVLGFSVLQAAFAAAIQVKGPNPFYGRGAFAGRYSVLGGLKKGSFRFPIEFGKQCEAEDGTVQELVLDYEIINGVLPLDMVENSPVTIRPNITFNYEIGEVVTLNTPEGEEAFVIQLDQFELKEGDQLVQGSRAWSSDRLSLDFLPFEMLKPYTTYTIYATAKLYRTNFGHPIGDALDTDMETITFTTGKGVDFIPMDNVLAAWPADQQFNYYQGEGMENFIHLASGQDELINGAIANGAILRLSNDQTEVDVDFAYDANINKITYNLPSLTPGYGYQAAIVFPDSVEPDTMLTFYFRVSNYGTFTEKVSALNFSALTGAELDWSASNTIGEPFGIEELVGIPWIPGGPCLQLSADLDATAWSESFRNRLIFGIGYFDLYAPLPECEYQVTGLNYEIAELENIERRELGLLPDKAIALTQDNIFRVDAANYTDYATGQTLPVSQVLEYIVPLIVDKDYRFLRNRYHSLLEFSNFDSEIGSYYQSDCNEAVLTGFTAYYNNGCNHIFNYVNYPDECDVYPDPDDNTTDQLIIPRELDFELTPASTYPVILEYTLPNNDKISALKTLQL